MRFNTLVPSLAGMAILFAGCAGEFQNYPLAYSKNKPVTDITDTAKQETVVRALSELYGPSPREIKVPEGLGLRNGGAYLANYTLVDGQTVPLAVVDQAGEKQPLAGGYSLYRKHCLHCHGVSGDGNGPTSDFLYPRPRDYRKGVFKFTSTQAGAKPSRDDLWRTINYGLHGTSMPGFEALMTQAEIQQVIDYVIFLSIRGESEILIAQDVADGAWDEQIESDAPQQGFAQTDWTKPSSTSAIYPLAKELAMMVGEKWSSAGDQVFNPPVPRVEPTNESILRGRELFLGYTKERLECWGCHGIQAAGNGKSFVDKKVFENVMFRKQVYQSIYTVDDRNMAVFEASASRLTQEQDERHARLRTLGLGGHGHDQHEGHNSVLNGLSVTVTFKPDQIGTRAEEIQSHLEHEFAGMKLTVKTDGTSDRPSITVAPPHPLKPELLSDLTHLFKMSVLSQVSNIGDGKGWVITYNGSIETTADASPQEQLFAKRRSELLGSAIRKHLLELLPGSQVNVVLSDTPADVETVIAAVSDSDSVKSTGVKILVDELVNDVKGYFSKIQTDWNGSMDDWQWPLRPANLNTGVYKGGRRPIDLYWRIAKGINGAKMPAHESTIKPEQIWDLVNFVIALPSRPELLRDATEPVRNDAPAQVASK